MLDSRGGTLGGGKTPTRYGPASADAAEQWALSASKKKKKKKKKKVNTKAKTTSKKNTSQIVNDTIIAEVIEPKKSSIGVSGFGSVKLIKIPENNILQTTKPVASDSALEQLYFDSIGTTEIINIARHDDIQTDYSSIVDASDINYQYSPNRLIAMQKTSSQYFSQFGISLDSYVPIVGTGPSGEIIYIEDTTGNLVINTVGMPSKYRVEVQVMTFNDLINDTIYT